MTEDEFTDVVDRLLEVGVPPTAVAKAFGIDPIVVRDRMNELRVEIYGAAELAEATAQMQWQALEQARAMLTEAPYTVRARFIMSILSRTMSLTARQSPETIGNMRRDLLTLMEQVEMADDPLATVDTQAFEAGSAVPVDEADEDQDEGPDD
jgi:hypothetical protein